MPHEAKDHERDGNERLMEEIVDELLYGDPDHALKRLEGAGFELEDLLL